MILGGLLVIPLFMIYVYRDRIKTASDANPLWVTPPQAAFRIWIFIDLFIDIAGIYALVNDTWPPLAWVFFAMTNTFNLLWALFFIHKTGMYFGLAFIMNLS